MPQTNPSGISTLLCSFITYYLRAHLERGISGENWRAVRAVGAAAPGCTSESGDLAGQGSVRALTRPPNPTAPHERQENPPSRGHSFPRSSGLCGRCAAPRGISSRVGLLKLRTGGGEKSPNNNNKKAAGHCPGERGVERSSLPPSRTPPPPQRPHQE